MFTHVTVGTNDLERARQFYDAVLMPLGLKRLTDLGANGSIWGDTTPAFFVLKPANGEPATFANGGPSASRLPRVMQWPRFMGQRSREAPKMKDPWGLGIGHRTPMPPTRGILMVTRSPRTASKRHRQFIMESRRIQTELGPISFYRAGANEVGQMTLILLNRSPDCEEPFDTGFIESLALCREVVQLLSESSSPPEPGVGEATRRCLACMKSLGVLQAAVMGWCEGTLVMQTLTRKHSMATIKHLLVPEAEQRPSEPSYGSSSHKDLDEVRDAKQHDQMDANEGETSPSVRNFSIISWKGIS